MGVLTDWCDDYTRKFQKDILVFKHNLHETDLFTDEALIKLLAKHPSELTDVCSMTNPDHPVYPNRFMTGDFRGTDPDVILAAAKAGRIWINLREAMLVHPEYKALLDQMYGELSEVSKKNIFKPRGGILISSPISQTPYHFDKTETLLWHVRGKKRVFIYPLTQKFISDEAYEEALVDSTDDDLPYDESFDQEARIVDLIPGEAACWRFSSPHRVDNSEFCVSITTEYSTAESASKNAIMTTNAALRQKLGRTPSYAKDGKVSRSVKMVVGQALKKAGVFKKPPQPDMVQFKIDPNVEGFVVETEPYERTF